MVPEMVLGIRNLKYWVLGPSSSGGFIGTVRVYRGYSRITYGLHRCRDSESLAGLPPRDEMLALPRRPEVSMAHLPRQDPSTQHLWFLIPKIGMVSPETSNIGYLDPLAPLATESWIWTGKAELFNTRDPN